MTHTSYTLSHLMTPSYTETLEELEAFAAVSECPTWRQIYDAKREFDFLRALHAAENNPTSANLAALFDAEHYESKGGDHE